MLLRKAVEKSVDYKRKVLKNKQNPILGYPKINQDIIKKSRKRLLEKKTEHQYSS